MDKSVVCIVPIPIILPLKIHKIDRMKENCSHRSNNFPPSISPAVVKINYFFMFFRLNLQVNKTRWTSGAGEAHIPRSLCSESCPIGHFRNFQVSEEFFRLTVIKISKGNTK